MIFPRDWLVCFYDPVKGRRRWWHRFLKAGFRHCNAVAYLPTKDLWLVVDWGYQGLAVYMLTPDEIRPTFIALAEIGHVLKVKAPAFEARPNFRVWAEWPNHCVAMVRNLIGFTPRCFTPWRLFCALRATGASPIFAREPARSGASHGEPV